MKNSSKPEPGTIILRWDYSPTDFFGEPFNLEQDDCFWEFNEGAATATTNSEDDDRNRRKRLKKDLDAIIKMIFNIAQVNTHKTYELSKPCMEGYDSRGSLWITPAPATLKLSVSGPEPKVVIRDSNGNIILDERTLERRELVKLSAKYYENLEVQAILQNYKSAVNEPKNELFHLYAIRDVLSTKFEGFENACASLNLKKSDWEKLGKLCNRIPAQQGRHKGINYKQLRQATVAELEDARKIVKKMIKQFFMYLENSENH